MSAIYLNQLSSESFYDIEEPIKNLRRSRHLALRLSVGSSNQALSGSTSLIPVAAQTSLKASFSKFL